jgi:uncharacterized protein YydD (DUF2326 family)
MYIKRLSIIEGNGTLVRRIDFHNGINLIVDETPGAGGLETGNNVGKTTVLMLVDFCLGANPKSIYTDPENKREEYRLVKSFLIEKEILIELILKEDLSNPSSIEFQIERNFLPGKQVIRKINGTQMTETEFEEALTNMLFRGHYGKKPTFPQIISHNIRYKDQIIDNTLRTLNKYSRDDEYETLYLFLLGCDFDQGDLKQSLLAQIRIEQTFKDRLERDQTKSAYETALSIIDSDINNLNRQKALLQLNENFESDLNDLTRTKYGINSLSSEISKLSIRRDLISEAQMELTSHSTQMDLEQLEVVYKQATDKIPAIQKTFEDLVKFHNRMIDEKVKYITKDLPALEKEISDKRKHLGRLLQIEASLAGAIAKSDSFEGIENLIVDLNEKHRKKGEYENTIRQINEVEANISHINKQLGEINHALFSDEFEQKVKTQLNKFNKFFSEISNELYGEKYAIKFDRVVNKNGQRLYKFSAFNLNFSSGKKQGEISCFDIAYTLFADQENIPCLHFLLNDKKELMHDNQLLKIAKLVNEKGIQFVASILKDKLPNELNREEFIVVRLSQNNKLFRIENTSKPKND